MSFNLNNFLGKQDTSWEKASYTPTTTTSNSSLNEGDTLALDSFNFESSQFTPNNSDFATMNVANNLNLFPSSVIEGQTSNNNNNPIFDDLPIIPIDEKISPYQEARANISESETTNFLRLGEGDLFDPRNLIAYDLAKPTHYVIGGKTELPGKGNKMLLVMLPSIEQTHSLAKDILLDADPSNFDRVVNNSTIFLSYKIGPVEGVVTYNNETKSLEVGAGLMANSIPNMKGIDFTMFLNGRAKLDDITDPGSVVPTLNYGGFLSLNKDNLQDKVGFGSPKFDNQLKNITNKAVDQLLDKIPPMLVVPNSVPGAAGFVLKQGLQEAIKYGFSAGVSPVAGVAKQINPYNIPSVFALPEDHDFFPEVVMP